MTTDDIIIRLFCIVDDRLSTIKKHPLAKLHPSNVVTIGFLTLKGRCYRIFYRWLQVKVRWDSGVVELVKDGLVRVEDTV